VKHEEGPVNDHLEPRIRVLLGSSIAIGPGKAALLEAIGETGSIAAAGRRMGMSYRRAWVLAKTMNACFREPLIEATKGGVGGGGARLTAMGQEVLFLYRTMEDHATTAVIADMAKLRALMVEEPP
jgi:molybdate transport system regulatory protein